MIQRKTVRKKSAAYDAKVWPKERSFCPLIDAIGKRSLWD